jgi:hypothetical protein
LATKRWKAEKYFAGEDEKESYGVRVTYGNVKFLTIKKKISNSFKHYLEQNKKCPELYWDII